MKKYIVYILECADGSYYTGITNDLNRRIEEHHNGYDSKCYTYNKRPLQIVFTEQFHFVLQAIAREKQIKGWSRKKKAALIAGNIDQLRALALNSNKQSKE